MENEVLVSVLAFVSVLTPITLAIVQMIKSSIPMSKNYVPVISFAVGIAIGFAGQPFTDLELVSRLWAGALSGLAAVGLFEVVNKREGETKDTRED